MTGALSAFLTVRVFMKQPEARFMPMMGQTLIKGEIPEPLKDCEDVYNKYCKEIEPGGGRIIRCLNAHEAELNEACKIAIKKIPVSPR
ncbi:MAG: cysteine rich repeat-containing protein [Pseudobdellovibrionaceae bacterium]